MRQSGFKPFHHHAACVCIADESTAKECAGRQGLIGKQSACARDVPKHLEHHVLASQCNQVKTFCTI